MKLYGIEDVIPLLNQEELGDLVLKMYAEINGDEYTLTTKKAVVLWPTVHRLNSEKIRQAKKYFKKKKEKCFNENRRKDNNQS